MKTSVSLLNKKIFSLIYKTKAAQTYDSIISLYLTQMKSELYFDISSETSGGSLYKTNDPGAKEVFIYNYSNYDDDSDDIKVNKITFASFKDFWREITKNAEWFYMHPLYVHPEVREFIQQELQQVDWTVQGDFKWQESHKRQWKKVLTDPHSYYRSSQ